MSTPHGSAAPASGPTEPAKAAIPTFEALAADPEIEALFDFDPVPRKRDVEGGWTPEAQREFIARLAVHGSATKACDEMGKNQTGIMKLYRSPLGASFRAAWDGAVDLAKRRRAQAEQAQPVSPGTRPPTIDHRRKNPHPDRLPRAGKGEAGQILNEYGEWEDENSLQRRAEDARDSITRKILNARRLYLREISGHPARRAAFEILADVPVDWDKAARLEAQPDEPFNRANMRQPDMLLTAENGWLGDMTTGGPDRKAELMRAINEYRAAEGLPAIDWDAE